MSIGAGGILGASLMLGLMLGTTAVVAQTPAQGTWTDPPARGIALTPPQPSVASPAAPVREPASAAAEASSGRPPEGIVGETTATLRKSENAAPTVVRHAAAPERKRVRQAARTRPNVVAAAPRFRSAAPRFAERREPAKSMPRRVVARSFAPRTVAAYPYPYSPLPVGRVAGPGDGERNPVFADGDDRLRRIAAAQAAGYLVVRSRSVQFPDGRMIRSYRPYEDEDGLD